jgi:hypothetical protein
MKNHWLYLFLSLLLFSGCHVGSFRIGQYVKDKNGTVYIILDERPWNNNYLCKAVYGGERVIKTPDELELVRKELSP